MYRKLCIVVWSQYRMNKHFMKTNCFAFCFCAFVVAVIDSRFNKMIFFRKSFRKK